MMCTSSPQALSISVDDVDCLLNAHAKEQTPWVLGLDLGVALNVELF